MTQLTSVRTISSAESRLITGVCAAHMMSHYYMLVLAPLLAFVRADFNVSYTELALALTVFNVVSGVLQTPVGFLVDRIGARVVLIAGLALSSAAFAIAGLFDSYWVFIAMYSVAGLGNTAYHPADYSLLSHHSPPERLSQVFSFHTFAGMLGSAIAPVTLLTMQTYFGWRGAYLGAALLGFVVLAALIAQPEPIAALRPAGKSSKGASQAGGTGWRLLLSPAILLNLAFFTLTAIMGNGLNTYLVVALGALHATPPAIANIALTSLLTMNAIGVLAGGVLASHMRQHVLIAASGLTIGGCMTALIGLVALPSALLIVLTGVSGFAVGATYPSRDMLVRAVTPPGAYGRVFGFVSTGFNIGASIAPIVYGMLMDHGQPRGIFLLSAVVSLICVSTVMFGFSGREKE
ncbi:MAG: MFS transporter [Xanthobacteraceae bacterium]|jgi:MFS family permease